MQNKEILFDKTEIVLTLEGKNKYETLNVTYDKIMHIKFDHCIEHKLFKKVPSEKIEIKIKNRPLPVIYTKLKSKIYFDEYKEGLINFCIINRITFIDNLSVSNVQAKV